MASATPTVGAQGRNVASENSARDALLPRAESAEDKSQYARPAALLLSALCFAALLAAGVVGFRWSQGSASRPWGSARPLSRLDKPLVILISMDGFRNSYHDKLPPNSTILRFMLESTVSVNGMYPPFPSQTFPSHTSMATGLYPAWHGIVMNEFVDPKNTSHAFSRPTLDPSWYLGEPIWETVTKQGLIAASVFWPGSNIQKPHWTCPPDRCFVRYNASWTLLQRVNTALAWVNLPPASRPSFIALYLDQPDKAGHVAGPDTPEVAAALLQADQALAALLDGLHAAGVAKDVHIILTSDHGMVATCNDRAVYLADLVGHVTGFNRSWISSQPGNSIVGLLPPPGIDPNVAFQQITAALPYVKNSKYINFYLKKDIPDQYHLSTSDRIPPIVGLMAEGSLVVYDSSDWWTSCFGDHGYDNQLVSMRAQFMARGPRFAPGRALLKPFFNVEVYNIVASILGLVPAPNNGSAVFANSLLLPY